MRRCHKFDDFHCDRVDIPGMQVLRLVNGREARCARIIPRIGEAHDFEHLPLPRLVTRLLYAGYGSAAANVLGGIIVANDISCVPSHL